MATVIENRSHWNDWIKGIDAKFAEVFDQTKDTYKSDADKLFRAKSSDQARERTSGKTPYGFLKATNEGGNIEKGSRQKTYDTEYVFSKYTGGIEVTMEEIEDRDYSDKLDEMKDLSVADKVTRDKNYAEVFNRAFDTNAGTDGLNITRYGDGKALCSTIHPRKDGGTAQSNASSNGIALSTDNLNIALVALTEQLLDDGEPTSSQGKPILVVPPALTRSAVQITMSELDANTANNNINYYKGVIADVVEIKWIGTALGGSDTQWTVVNPSISKLISYNRKSAELRRSVNEENLNRLYSVNARWAAGHSDWRGVWGSKGDGAAYSS